MKTLTRQDIFNISASGLLKQGKASKDSSSCMYRGPNGLKCAIGMLIPDELYKPRFEGYSASGFGVRKALVKAGVPNTVAFVNFLVRLQKVHDDHLVEDWDCELVNFAHHYDLNPLPMYEGVKELP